MGMTRWQPGNKDNLPFAHTALGGFPLALFGSGNMHSWPAALDQVHTCFLDETEIQNDLFDDSAHRKALWSNAATGLGAILHEIGHSFQLRHTNLAPSRKRSLLHPVMGRGFDHFNRIFGLAEPFGFTFGKLNPLIREEEESNLHSHSLVRLLYNPFFPSSPSSQGFVASSNDGPSIERMGDIICVRSLDGIVEVSLYHLQNGDVLLTQVYGALPSPVATLFVETVRRLCGPSAQYVGCTAMDRFGRVANQLIPMKKMTVQQASLQQLGINSSGVSSSRGLVIGARIRLMHLLTGQYVQSYPVNYVHPNSSGYQQVSCVEAYRKDEEASEWQLVLPPGIDRLKEGSQIRYQEDTFMLLNVATGQYLHSQRGIPSPITHQQEVCCFPHDHDANNLWTCQPKTDEQSHWIPDEAVLLLHVASSTYLHSHGGFKSEEFTTGQQEATCWPHKNDENNFFVAEMI